MSHPTRVILDIHTIQREIGVLDDIKVGLVSDLANKQPNCSFTYRLNKYNGVKITMFQQWL